MIKLTGSEKAFLGGLVAFLATTIVQLNQSGQLTLKELGYSLGSFIVTHLTVWSATNSPAAVGPISAEAPVVEAAPEA